MKLILVRHGETEHNKTGTHVGQLDIPLNDRGREQARLVAERLADEQIDAIYTSDLQRANDTALAITVHHPGLSVATDVLLRERNVGKLTGQPIRPEDSLRKSGDGGINRLRRPENGESLQDVKVRAKSWLEKTLATHPNDTVLVAGHGLFLFVLLEVAVEDGADTDRGDFILNNTSVTVLDLHQGKQTQIIYLNDATHLDGVGVLKAE